MPRCHRRLGVAWPRRPGEHLAALTGPLWPRPARFPRFHRQQPIRKFFAALLLCAALVPVGLVVYHQIAPARMFHAWGQTQALALQSVLYGLGAGLLALLYPPSLPFLRLRGRELWRRLGTDRTPMYDSIARLEHLETHDDHLKVGRMALQLGETALAVEHLSRAHALDSTHVSGQFHYALVLADTGRDEEATTLLESVLEADEKHAFGDAMFHLGRLRFRMRQHQTAITVLRRHQELFPGGRQAALILAKALAATGDLEAAQQAREIARRPVEADVHLLPAEALAKAQALVTVLRRGSSDA